MKWEELTSKKFHEVIENNPVCLLTFGVIEKHGDHLPLGTDFLNVHRLAVLATELEEAVVFPPFYFGQILEARCFPGTIALPSILLMKLVQTIMNEIGRNGIKKIILVNGHGGNNAFLTFLAQSQLEQEYPYQVYLYQGASPEKTKLYQETTTTKWHGHACECETSISLANHPSLVDMSKIPQEEITPKRRLASIPHLFTGLSWYANYPDHYVGDAKVATAEKGKILQDFEVNELAKFIKLVKEDQVLPTLSQEFHSKTKH